MIDPALSPPPRIEPDMQRYETMLAEAAHLRGTSLGRDAWKRLRKRWTSMAALGFLVSLVLLAILTPMLPLQPPRYQDLKKKYQSPAIGSGHSLFIRSTALPESMDDSDANKKLSDGFGAPYVVLKKNVAPDKDVKSEAAAEPSSAKKQISTASESDLGWFSNQLLRLRVRLFGNLCFNSLCGTDSLGRDLLSRICWGTRVSLAAAFVATLVSLSIGVLYGAIAGYVGGMVDNIMMRIVDVLYSIPIIFVAIFMITILDDENYQRFLTKYGIGRMTIFYIIIGALYWLTMARVVRGQVLSLKHFQFVEAARSQGATLQKIIFRHLVPNVMSVVIVYLTLTIPSVMLTEAFLSYLGLGVRAPDVSWGILANEGIKVITPVKVYWWLILFPSAMIGVTLYSLNFLGDGLRDALDPRLKRG